MNIACNGQPREVSDDTTIAQLLDQLEVSPKHVAVEVNLELIPRASHTEVMLREGDQIEVVTLVGGG